jgi:hypothetical protein
MPLPIPVAEKSPVRVPGFSHWLGAHLGLIAVAAGLVEAFSKQGLAWIVVVGPFCLGVAQAAMLWRRLPVWAAVLWPMATAMGWVASTVFAWFMYHLLGLCLGVCQAGLLGVGRFRGWFLWPLVSGLSWGLALQGWFLITSLSSTSTVVNTVSHGVGWVLALVCYSISTGLALKWMGRRPATAA